MFPTVVKLIDPSIPPPPICSKRPFQPLAGIHTSQLILELSSGLVTPLTRQKGGIPVKLYVLPTAVRLRVPPGRVSAVVMLVLPGKCTLVQNAALGRINGCARDFTIVGLVPAARCVYHPHDQEHYRHLDQHAYYRGECRARVCHLTAKIFDTIIEHPLTQ